MHNIFRSRFGITIIGWASDGDPRLLSAMCYQIVKQPTNCIEYVQDMTHIATKLRNRLINMKTMNMGNRSVSINHLYQLLTNVQKSVHGLTKTDICPTDRQNFESFLKITNHRVIDALKKYIPNSEATAIYLQMCSDVTSSYLDYDITPLERIFRIHRWIFFLRIWKNYIKNSQYHNLQENFLTSNTYTGIEINGKSVLSLVDKFRRNETPHFFLLPVFDSQTCEKTFRQLRSMGTVNFTKINFSLYEIMHMVGRIELQNEIAYFKLPQKDVKFPTDHKRRQHTTLFDLPSNLDVASSLEDAKKAAIADAISLGMPPENFDEYEFQSRVNFETIESDRDTLFDEEVEEIENADDDSNEHSPFTTVIDENGSEMVIRKSTLIWMLSEPSKAISKDRLRRVQVSSVNT